MDDTHFHDRIDAGLQLAGILRDYVDQNAIVFGLPRGGVIVAAEVSKKLGLPLDLAFSRKIGHPNNEEYAVGAVAEDGTFVGSEEEVSKIEPTWLEGEARRQMDIMKNRRALYLAGKSSPRITGRTAIVIDDGIATGFTMIAALRMLRKQKPKKIIAAVPVMPAVALSVLREEADETVTLYADPFFLGAVGAYYDQFPEVSDADIFTVLAHASA